MKFNKILGAVMLVLGMGALTACVTEERVPTEEEIAGHNMALELLDNQTFMIKADRLSISSRSVPGISPSTNFIVVDGDKVTVQVSPRVSGGPNGMGGFTVNGRISGYKVDRTKSGDLTVRFNVTAVVGSCFVNINMKKDTNYATASINGTFSGGNAVIYGQVAPIDNTIFKGYSRF